MNAHMIYRISIWNHQRDTGIDTKQQTQKAERNALSKPEIRAALQQIFTYVSTKTYLWFAQREPQTNV